jgi:hypothetical protein
MSELPTHPVFEWSKLQDLIDEALIEVYNDYDMSESIRTRAVAIHDDGFHRELSLRRANELSGLLRRAIELSGLQATLEDAINAIDALGGRVGYALVYVKENGRELVFLAAINHAEKGICTLEMKRETGDELRDLLPVSVDADGSFVRSLEWGQSRRKVDVEIRDDYRISGAVEQRHQLRRRDCIHLRRFDRAADPGHLSKVLRAESDGLYSGDFLRRDGSGGLHRGGGIWCVGPYSSGTKRTNY